MNYATPSSRFSRPAVNQQPPMNFYAPPANTQYSNSGIDNTSADPSTGVIPADTTQKYFAPAPDNNRPGSTTKTQAQLDAEASANKQASGYAAVDAGFGNSSVGASTDTTGQVVNVLGNTAAGALSGAAAGSVVGGIGAVPGAVIGGGVALVSSGLNAWLGNRQARAEQDRAAALNAAALRLRQQEIDRDEKWKVQNRSDTLEQAHYQRLQYAAQQNRQNMDATAQKLQGMLATNQSLKDHWQKYGFN